MDRLGYLREEHLDQSEVTLVLTRLDVDRLRLVDPVQGLAGGLDLVLDDLDVVLGLLLAAVHDQPAGALREVLAEPPDQRTEDGAEEEADPPADVDVDLVQQDERAQGSEDRTDPVGAVDGDVDPPSVLRRHHLVDRGVDRGVLAADAGSGDEPGAVEEGQGQGTVVPGERRQGVAEQVDAQRDDEEVLAAPLVGQVTEEQRAEDLTEQVDRGDRADLGRAQTERRFVGQNSRDCAGDGDLDAVQDPGGAERHHHLGVERRPAQAVDPRRDQAADGLAGGGVTRHRSLLRGGGCSGIPGIVPVSTDIGTPSLGRRTGGRRLLGAPARLRIFGVIPR